jgi:hypothetical protein
MTWRTDDFERLRPKGSRGERGEIRCGGAPRFRLQKRSVQSCKSACDELIDKDSQIAGCVHPELDESFRRSWAGRPAIAPSCPGPGTVKDDIVASLDWLPTLVDIAGADKGDALNKRIMAGSYPGIVKMQMIEEFRNYINKSKISSAA